MKASNRTREQESIRYCRVFDGAWARVTEWIEATVATWDEGWEARCSTGFPNVAREQWNVWSVFPTRDEAAAFAAAFVLKSEELVAAILAGEAPLMPHKAMRLACADEIDWIPRVVAARRKLAEASTPRENVNARDDLLRALREEETAWFRAHDWRDFVVDETTLAPTTEEDDHAERRQPAA